MQYGHVQLSRPASQYAAPARSTNRADSSELYARPSAEGASARARVVPSDDRPRAGRARAGRGRRGPSGAASREPARGSRTPPADVTSASATRSRAARALHARAMAPRSDEDAARDARLEQFCKFTDRQTERTERRRRDAFHKDACDGASTALHGVARRFVSARFVTNTHTKTPRVSSTATPLRATSA